MIKNQNNTTKNYLYYAKFVFIALWLIIFSILFLKNHPITTNPLNIFKLNSSVHISIFLKFLFNYSISFFLALGIIFNSFYIGNNFLKLFKFSQIFATLDIFILSTGIGFGLLAYIILFIGFIGLFYYYVLFPLWIILTILGIYQTIKLFKMKNSITYPIENKNWVITFSVIIITFLFLFNLLLSVTPEIFYDSLNYHLGVPNYFKVYHKILPMPYKTYSNFPLTISMLYTYGMILKGPIVAKLINWFLGIFVFLGIISFSVNIFKSLFIGIIGSTIFYTTPNVIFRSWTATNDIGLTLFVFFALYMLILAKKNKYKGFIILSGIFAGFASGSKYTSIFFIFALLVVLLFYFNIKKILIWLLFYILFFSPWLIKNYIYTGNPFHPMFYSHFNVKYPHNVNKSPANVFFPKNKKELLKKVEKMFYMPFILGIEGGGNKHFYYPDYYMMGIIYLLFLPLIIFYIKKNHFSILKILLLFIIFSFPFWAIYSNWKVKYYTPAFPTLSILSAYVLWQINKKSLILKYLSNILFIFFIAFNFIYMLPMAKFYNDPFNLFYGTLSRNEFLSKSRPMYPNPSYDVYQYINKNLDKKVRILIFGDAKCLYIDRKFTIFSVGGLNPLIEYIHHSKDAKTLFENLKLGGYTHLVVNVPEAIQTGIYGNLYFKKGDFKILDQFFNNYTHLLYQSNYVYLFGLRIFKNNTSFDPVKIAYKNYILKETNELLGKKLFKKALKNIDHLLEVEIDDDSIYYFKAVCYYYLKDYTNAKTFAEKAYKMNPQKLYKNFLNLLNGDDG